MKTGANGRKALGQIETVTIEEGKRITEIIQPCPSQLNVKIGEFDWIATRFAVTV